MFQIPAWFAIAVSLGVCGSAFLVGGASERVAGAGYLVGWLVTLLLKDRTWTGLQEGGFAVDVAYLALLTAIALRSRRYWPLFAAAFQFLAVVTHAARLADDSVGAWAYITAGVIWTYLLLGALAVGVWNRWREAQPTSATPKAAPGATRR